VVPVKRRSRTLVASALLVAFALRALIPQGFMPGGGFSLEICWEGLPAAMLALAEPADSAHAGHHPGAHGHTGHPSSSDHCVFGTACSPGPLTHLPQPGDFSAPPPLRAAAFVSIASAIRLVHLPQSRAPPGQLS
jgi:hypothetical protein